MRETVCVDMGRWDSDRRLTECNQFQNIFKRYPEFRSLFYYRLRNMKAKRLNRLTKRLLMRTYEGRINLYIHTKHIGKGLRILHGFSTIISANSIGENCLVCQQVTIGYSNATDCPTIGNNVYILAGAKIIGGVVIGDNVTIGANAVVVKNVPSNCTVVGVPASIVKKNGIRVNEEL